MSRFKKAIGAAMVAVFLTISLPAVAHTSSGDHVGCVYETRAHFWQQVNNGSVSYYLEGESPATLFKKFATGNRHWTRGGFWAGGIWSVGGNHPQSGAYVTCG
jgi:hypothetical protein